MILWSDFRYAFRTLRKSPGFVLVVVMTLTLGIGANTTIFSVAQAVFFRSMNYPDGKRLVFVSRGYPGFPQGGGNFTYPAYRDMIAQNTSFDALAAYQSFGALALTDGVEPVRINVNYVTPSYLQLLGAQTSAGRTFRREEDRWGDADPIIVLSYGFWQRQYGGDGNIVGRTIHLNGQALTVIGVSAESFRDAPGEIDGGGVVDAWIPLGLSYKLTGYSNLADRNAALLWGIGHLKAGVTLRQAQADLAGIQKQFAKTYPDRETGFTLVANSLQDRLVGAFYSAVWLLIGASGFILLIGCANVANLLLARLASRQREFVVRSALGATASRLTRQMLVENSLLVGLAAALGILLSAWGIEALRWWGQRNLPAVLQFKTDLSMLLASVAVSVLTLFLFGLGPALVGARVDLRDALSQTGRQGISLGGRRAAKFLIVWEVSLALVLLVGAGLLLKSFHRMTTIDLGFNTRNLLTLRLDLNSDKYTPNAVRTQFARMLVDKLQGLPGVQSATLWGPSIPGRATWVIQAIPEGRQPDDPRSIVMSARHSVNPSALSNMGISILRGRDFTWHDDGNAPLVAIVSESTARISWPGQDPIGKRFHSTSSPDWITVIGVASDARLRQRLELSDAAIGIAPGGLGPQLDVYLPYAQRPNRAVVVAVRGQGDSADMTKAVQAAVLSIDSTIPVYDVAMLDNRLAAQDHPCQALTTVTGLYALLALFLAALGLFGVLAHTVSRRTQELGIRMALGAVPRDLLWMVLREGLLLSGLGIVAGLAASLLLTRGITSLLFGVSATDPITYLGISLLLVAVAAAACYAPARRATKVDPIVALRYE